MDPQNEENKQKEEDYGDFVYEEEKPVEKTSKGSKVNKSIHDSQKDEEKPNDSKVNKSIHDSKKDEENQNESKINKSIHDSKKDEEKKNESKINKSIHESKKDEEKKNDSKINKSKQETKKEEEKEVEKTDNYLDTSLKDTENNKEEQELNKSKSKKNTQNLNESKKEESKVNRSTHSKLNKEEVSKEEEKKEEYKCDKCSGNKRNFEFSCNHKICLDCILSFFISSNLSNLSLEELYFTCNLCKQGECVFTIDEFIKILNDLQECKEERNRTMKAIKEMPKKKCFVHKDQEVVGYCQNCRLWLCEECKKLYHNTYYPQHTFSENEEVNIFCDAHKTEVVEYFCLTCQKEMCKQCTEPRKGHDLHRIISLTEYKANTRRENGSSSLNYKNYDEFETYLNKLKNNLIQKIESDLVTKTSKIQELVDILIKLKTEYEIQTKNFTEKMKKIFMVIEQTYFNYFSDKPEDQEKIRFQSSLTDISLISKKKVNLDELFILVSNDIEKFEEIENPERNPALITTLDYQLVWNNNQISKTSALNKMTILKKEEPKAPTQPKVNKTFKKGKTNKTGKVKSTNSQRKVGEQTIEVTLENGHKEGITKIIQIKPDIIASASIDSTIVIWDLNTEKPSLRLEEHKSSIWSLCYDPSTNRLFSGSSDKTIIQWNPDSGYVVNTLKGHRGTVYALALSKEKNLISGSSDRTIKVWAEQEGNYKCLFTINTGATITSIGTLIDNFIICSADDNELKLINLNQKKIDASIKGHGCTVWCVAVFEDAIHIATGSSDNSIKIWDLNKKGIVFSLEGHRNTVSQLRVLKNGTLASASWDKTIKFWNLSTKICIFTIEGHDGIVYDLIELDNGKIASCSEDKSIIIWNKS